MSTVNGSAIKKDKSKRKKLFQTSKPSYLLTSIPSQLMKDIDERLNQMTSKEQKTLSPPPVTIKKILPKKIPQSKSKPQTTNTHSISVNKQLPSQKTLIKRNLRPMYSPQKRTHSLSLNNSNSFAKGKKLNNSNSYSHGKNNIKKVIKDVSNCTSNNTITNQPRKKSFSISIGSSNNNINSHKVLQKKNSDKDNKHLITTPQKKIQSAKSTIRTKKMFTTAQKKPTNANINKKPMHSAHQSIGTTSSTNNIRKNDKFNNNKKIKSNNSSPAMKMKKKNSGTKQPNVEDTKKKLFSLTDLHKSAPFNTKPTVSNSKTTISSSRTRRVSKIDSCTMAGYSEPNVQKMNQDNFFIEKSIFNDPEQFFVGVCDGHGLYGHLCSDFISSNLPDYLNAEYKSNNKASLSSLITKSFTSFNNELITEKEIDSKFSGTTCVSVLLFQDKLICANLGDSRAVLGCYEKGAYTTVSLSRDHKPTETDESERITKQGGRIAPYYEEETKEFIGPKRIWLKDSDIPGLAMTRSFGDQIAHCVGVTAEPEIKEYNYSGNERFVILASDGVWEFIDSEESVHIVKDYYEKDMDANGAVKALVQEAFRRWRREEDIVDDITAVVIFFE